MSGQIITAKPDPAAIQAGLKWVDLSHPRLGTRMIFATDDFFAARERLIAPEAPVFIPGKYDDNGKYMDGWESRRKRGSGHDYAIMALGAPGRIHALDIDTSHFTGNFPPRASIEVCNCRGRPDEMTKWEMLVEPTALAGDAHHVLGIDDMRIWNHVKLNIFPDGGVARLRVFGEIYKDWQLVGKDEEIDLAAQLNGGTAIAWNDAYFGRVENMLAPGRGANMGDGWETRRRREPGHDWAVIKLGHAGRITGFLIDTAFFKGNFPHKISVQGAYAPDPARLEEQSAGWPFLLGEEKPGADQEHVFTAQIKPHEAVTHLRLNMIPDGGISRFRAFGYKAT